METQVVEKIEEKNLLLLLKELEEERDEKDYPEFDDWAN
jgi:hypothetical protein